MDFQSLYEKYAPAVRRFALFLCGDPMMADDITSETFLRALRAHEHIRQPTVRSYLFAVAQNAYRDMQRRSRPQAKLDKTKPGAGISAQTHLELKEELRAVLARCSNCRRLIARFCSCARWTICRTRRSRLL
ncbi:MAG: RNA polymerase sigma factor [Terriglobia bacterium]